MYTCSTETLSNICGSIEKQVAVLEFNTVKSVVEKIKFKK